MIVQSFKLNNEKLIDIYHKLDSKQYKNRTLLKESKNVSNLIFEEKIIEVLAPSEHWSILEGYLDSDHDKNPYHSWSTKFTEYLSTDNPLFDSNKLMIEEQKYEFICDFIKEHSGYNISEYPMSFGNTVIFEPYYFDIKLDRLENDLTSIEILGLTDDCMSIVKLKKNQFLFETEIVYGSICVLEPSFDWQSMDIEVYRDKKLIYSTYNYTTMRRIVLNMNMVGRQSSSKLSSNKEVQLVSTSKMVVEHGDIDNNELIDYIVDESKLKNELRSKRNSKIWFLKRNEIDRADEIFIDIVSADYNEIWIFDPYFTSENASYKRMTDIYLILSKQVNKPKHVVFEMNKTTLPLSEFIERIESPEVKSLNKKFGSLNWNYHESKEHFHDRFIFLCADKNIRGYICGTSLNSFGDNYSTLIRMNQYDSRRIYDELRKSLT